MAYTAAELTTIYTNANDGLAPDSATELLLQAYATQDQNGTLTDAQTLSTALHIHPTDGSVIDSPESTTDVAVATYQFFSGVGNGGQGTTVTQAGLNYLVNPATGGNANALGGAYYAQFDQANRYINFAVNLGTGAGQFAASFAQVYGGLTFDQTVSTAYESIVGTANVGAANAQAAIAAIEGQQAYFTQFVAEYAPSANQDLALKAAVIGYILEEAIKADVGTYATAVDGFDNALGTGGTPAFGANLLAAATATGSANYVLTTGVDTITTNAAVNTIQASLTPYLVNGVGPTLNPGDSITGTGSNNTLVINDAGSIAGISADTIPAGVSITGVQHVVLDTSNNAGSGAAALDVTSIAGLTDVTVNSGGAGVDTVKALSTTAIIVNHGASNTVEGVIGETATGVQTFGGSSVTITAGSGDVSVGSLNAAGADPTGAVAVTDQSTGNISIYGGTDVSVTTAGSTTGNGTSQIVIGNHTPSTIPANPTGNVTVLDTGTDTTNQTFGEGGGGGPPDIQIYGGQTVSVTASGDSVSIGGLSTDGVTSLNPTGNVTVANTAANPLHYSAISGEAGFETDVTVGGGANVTVANNAGSVFIGTDAVNDSGGALSAPTGVILVNQTTNDPNVATVVYGGTNVTVTAAGGLVQVGGEGQFSSGDFAPFGVSPTGAITINDTASAAVAAVGGQQISAFGGSSVSITTNVAAVQVGAFDPGADGLPEPGEITTGPISVTDTSANVVEVLGGSTVAVASSGGDVFIGDAATGGVFNATGAITATDSAATPYDAILNSDAALVDVVGGTSVAIATNAGGVIVGDQAAGAGDQPTGAISVTSSAANGGDIGGGASAIAIYGGTTVSVTATGGASVLVGDPTTLGDNPTGAVTIAQSGVETGGQYSSGVAVYGAPSVTIATTGAGLAFGEGGPPASITVGSDAAPIAGPVSITDTFVGVNADSVSVEGGSTVAITTTATSGNITVGVAGTLTSTGALANGADSPTGAVSIVNESLAGTAAAGAANVYGTGNATVNTDGSTSVSIIGAGAVSVTDVQTAVAPGTSTLSSVYLEGLSGNATLTSDALTTVSLVNAQAPITLEVVNTTAGHALNADITGAVGGPVTLQDNTATALSLSTGVGAPEAIDLNLADATALTVINAETLTLTNVSALHVLTSITANGSGNLYLGDLSADATLTSINASHGSGAVVVEIDPTVTAFTGGAGSDYVVITNGIDTNATTGTFNDVQAGSGANNTLIADYADAGLNSLKASFGGFSVLAVEDVTANGAQGAANGVFNTTGFSSLQALSGANTYGVTFDAAGQPLTFGSDGTTPTPATTTVTYDLTAATGALALGITEGVNATTATPVSPVTSGLNEALILGDGSTAATQASISTLNVASTGSGVGTNTLAITDNLSTATAHVTTLNVTGAEAITLSYTAASGGVSTINASGASGEVNVNNVATAAGGVTITGGSGLLTAHGSPAGSTTAIDALNSGSGGATFTLGYGGSWNPTLAEPDSGTGGYDSGHETVNLAASTATADTLNIANVTAGQDGVVSNNTGSGGGVSGFQAIASLTTDAIQFNTGAEAVLQNQGTTTIVGSLTNAQTDAQVLDTSGQLGTALSELTYTSSNGVITFGATGTNNTSQFSANQLIDATEIILKDSNGGGADSVALFVSGGNTYVVSSSGDDTISSASNGFNVVELNGQSDTGGFGYLGAANTISATDPTQGFADGYVTGNAITHGTPAGTSVTYNDAGYSIDLGGGYATGSTTITNLAASAIIGIDAAADAAVTINQAGAAGGNSLIAVLEAGQNLTSLTVSGDYVLQLFDEATNTVRSLVDSTNTLATLQVAGEGDITIGGVTSTALKTIDAHTLGGSLTLTANQTGLTILGSATGTNTITASGAGDTITANAPTLTAGGAGDVITATGTAIIHAGGAADTFTLGTAAVAANGATLDGGFIGNTTATVSLGAGDVINFVNDTTGGNYTAQLGASSTVNLAPTFAGNVTLTVTGDTAGTTSAGAFHLTTVNGAATSEAALSLTFNEVGANGTEAFAGGSAAASEVNTAGVTTLAQAIDLAVSQAAKLDQEFGGGTHTSTTTGALTLNAHTGLIDYFQFHGNTYVVETVNAGATAAAHTALQSTDVVVELTGLVNLTGAGTLDGHTLHAFGLAV